MAGLFDFSQPSAAPTYAGQTDPGIYPFAPQASAGAAPSILPSWLGGAASLGNQGYGATMGTSNPALFYAMMIGLGKNIESTQPNNGLGMGLLGGLAPSGNQIAKDPMGMGLPTLLGAPFLTPFTSSKAAQAARPEWQSLFSLGS